MRETGSSSSAGMVSVSGASGSESYQFLISYMNHADMQFREPKPFCAVCLGGQALMLHRQALKTAPLEDRDACAATA